MYICIYIDKSSIPWHSWEHDILIYNIYIYIEWTGLKFKPLEKQNQTGTVRMGQQNDAKIPMRVSLRIPGKVPTL